MYPIGKVWLNVCSQADDGKSNAGDMQGRSQCREENNEKDMYLYIYMVPPVPMKKVDFRGGVTIYIYIYVWSPFKIGLKIQGPKKVIKHRKYC